MSIQVEWKNENVTSVFGDPVAGSYTRALILKRKFCSEMR